MCLHVWVGVWEQTSIRARVCARMCVKGLTISVRLNVRTIVCGCAYVCECVWVRRYVVAALRVYAHRHRGAALCAHGSVPPKRKGDAMMERSLNKKVGVIA